MRKEVRTGGGKRVGRFEKKVRTGGGKRVGRFKKKKVRTG